MRRTLGRGILLTTASSDPSIPARASWFNRYILPGITFQSVVIAGGYGTGRELIEFFMVFGPTAGLLSMILVSATIWSAVSAASFEFARVFRAYEYRAFFRRLLGPGWFLFEILYLLLMLLVLAIVAAAAGEILSASFGIPQAVGVAAMMAAVAYLVFRGSSTIEKVLALWSFVLYGVYVAVVGLVWLTFSEQIQTAFASAALKPGWVVGGIAYAGYNVAVVPVVLFSIRHVETRREAVASGILSGLIGIIPGVLLFVAMVSQYPAVLDEAVPVNTVLDALDIPLLQVIFQVVLLGTLIETGTTLIHAVNQRIAATAEESGRALPGWARPLTALGALSMATVLAQFGLTDLIAQGYGTLTWAFLAVFVVPILTRGVYLVLRRSAGPA